MKAYILSQEDFDRLLHALEMEKLRRVEAILTRKTQPSVKVNQIHLWFRQVVSQWAADVKK